MSGYQVGSTLCRDSDAAVTEIVENFLYGDGTGHTEVATLTVDQVVREMEEYDIELTAAGFPPCFPGTQRTVSASMRIRATIATILEEAREAAAEEEEG